MPKQPTDPVQPSPDDDGRQMLAKLQRIYGRSSVAPDLFGRRPALPSEIQRLAAAHQRRQPERSGNTGAQKMKRG